MAKNHTCAQNTYTINDKSVTLYEISTRANNIKIMSFSRATGGDKTAKTISASGEYGINASWFARNVEEDKHIMNLAYQNGIRQGYFLKDEEVPVIGGTVTDGFTNSVGKSAIFLANGALGFTSSIEFSSSSLVKNSTWLQGGINLFLGESNWSDKFAIESEGEYDSPANRSAMVADLVNDKVYLFAVAQIVSPETFRDAIMKRLSIQDGVTTNKYHGIMLDGGGSTQMAGETINIRSTRRIPQIVGLKDKT